MACGKQNLPQCGNSGMSKLLDRFPADSKQLKFIHRFQISILYQLCTELAIFTPIPFLFMRMLVYRDQQLNFVLKNSRNYSSLH